jgi:hypothetical protein
MSTLVLSERPLRLWDEPGARSFREPDAPPRDPADAPPRDHDVPPRHDDAPAHHGHDAPPHHHHDAPTHREAPPHARITLADVLGAAWDGLAAGTTVACPVCHGELAPHGAGGRCRSCGTTLS